MVKSYEQLVAFGVVVSGEGNITYDSSGKHLLAPALENVGVWIARQGLCTKTLVPDSLETAVTSLACSPSSPQIASGYADGRIRFWNSDEGTCKGALNGHDQAVAVIRYNKLGFELASGGKDHDIILWDARTETYRYHLRGHRGQVTDLVFLDSGKKLVSSSKDKLLRVWDLEGQFCMQRVGDHYSEIWSIDVDPEERFLVSGSADMELRFYTIKHDSVDILKSFGEIQRQSKDRVATVRFNKLANLLACQVAGKTVEVYSVLDEATAKRAAKRRLRRKKDRKSADGGEEGIAVTAADVFKLLHILRASNKICSIAFCPVRIPQRTLATLAVSLNNNILQSYSISSSDCSKVLIAKHQGHRSVVRSVTLSSDNTLLMSTSHTTVSIWNPLTGSILRTIDSEGYGLCGLIILENDYALVGTEEGTIEIIHLQSSMFLEAVKAHGGFVRSMAAIPNENRFVTGGADHDVKVWEYHRKRKAGQNTKRLTVSIVKTMKMDSAVFVVAVSPDAKFIAVALLDYTVKVLFMDQQETFRTLDAATLPILCVDISSDGKLIVTGCADQKLRLWHADDLGNCKIITAHDYSVMAVKFVPNTHCMFSVGKDGLVKYWDADKFKLLLTLEGHHAGVWCLAISKRGDFVITGSRDRSIRRWNLTKETLIIEEGKGDVGV